MVDLNIRDVDVHTLISFKIIGVENNHKHQRETLKMLVEEYKKGDK